MKPPRGTRRRPRAALVAGAMLGVSIAGAAASFAAFTATTTNSGNEFSAAASFGGELRFASGTYTGTGADNRAITAPGFQPDLIIIKADNNQMGIIRSSSMAGDVSKRLDAAEALVSNGIQSLTGTGFTLGTRAEVNGNGTTYRWMAFRAAAGVLRVGSYTGNGAPTRVIADTGFQPEYVALVGAGAQRAVQRFAGMTTSFGFGAQTGTANAVSSLDAGGFTVGSAAEANNNGTSYHYVAFNEVAETIESTTYTGNATDNRTITGVGFQPDATLVRANDTVTGRAGRHRPGALADPASQFQSATANDTAGIKTLLADGFRLGTGSGVNANGVAYHALAFKNTAGGCALPGSVTVSANADSWIDQTAPATNQGSDSVLKVTSKSGSSNTRALVRYPLPDVPDGCAVTDAKLRINNKSPASGRTIQAQRAATAWTEAGVTWANQPAATGTAAVAATPGSAGIMQWTVTGLVQAMYSGANNGFVIRDQTENGSGPEQQFDSRESTPVPALVITYG